MAWQRVFRGWDDSQVWDFHSNHSEETRDKLKQLRDSNEGHPGDLTDAEWKQILGKMIDGFQAEVDIDQQRFMDISDDVAEWKRRHMELEWKAQEGWDMFRKYYRHLWD
jgi:hypothetical protein